MTRKEPLVRRGLKGVAIIVLGGPFMLGFLGECNDKLVQTTRYIDPCGTIFSTDYCTPGTFESQAAGIGDWSIDPTCPIPGGCGTDPYQPLGTIWDLDP